MKVNELNLGRKHTHSIHVTTPQQTHKEKQVLDSPRNHKISQKTTQ